MLKSNASHIVKSTPAVSEYTVIPITTEHVIKAAINTSSGSTSVHRYETAIDEKTVKRPNK